MEGYPEEKKVAVDADTKGKRRAVSKQDESATTASNLTKEEAEFVYGVPCNDALYDPTQVSVHSTLRPGAAGGPKERRRAVTHAGVPTVRACVQVLNLVAPSVQGVLVTAGGRGCGYAFRCPSCPTPAGTRRPAPVPSPRTWSVRWDARC